MPWSYIRDRSEVGISLRLANIPTATGKPGVLGRQRENYLFLYNIGPYWIFSYEGVLPELDRLGPILLVPVLRW